MVAEAHGLMLKDTKVDLALPDKIMHGLAKFFKNICCAKLSEHLMQKISEKGKNKIGAAKSAKLAASISVQNIAQVLAKHTNIEAVADKSQKLLSEKFRVQEAIRNKQGRRVR